MDGPGDSSNTGGPGDINDIDKVLPNVGGLNGAIGLHNTGLSFITALSIAILTLITKLLH